MVFLECYADFDAERGQYLEEVEFVEDEARRDPRLKAIVPMAPLEKGRGAAPILERDGREPPDGARHPPHRRVRRRPARR